MGEAVQMVNDFEMRLEAGFGRLLRVRLKVVDAADAIEKVKLQLQVVTQKSADLQEVFGANDHKRVHGVEFLALDLWAKLCLQASDDVGGGHVRPWLGWLVPWWPW